MKKKTEDENPYEFCPCGRKRSLGLTPTTAGFWCGSCKKTTWIDKAHRPKGEPKKEKEIKTSCKITKKGDAVFTARIVKKEIKFNSPSSKKRETVTVVSKSTDGTSASIVMTRRRKSSASLVVRTARVITNR